MHLATAALGPSAYGRFLTVVSFVTLFIFLNDLGVSAVGTRELAKHPDDSVQILGDNLTFRVSLSLILIPVVSGAALLVYPAQRSTLGVGIALMSVDLLLNAVQTTALTYFSSRVRNDIAGLVVMTGKVAYVGLIVAASSFRLSFFGYLGAYLIGDALATVLALVLLLRKIRPKIEVSFERWRLIVRSSFPLGILQIVASIYFWNGSIILSIFRDARSVAFYGLAVNVLLILAGTSGYFMTALLPAMATTRGPDLNRLVQSALDLVLLLAVPIAIGGFLLRHQLIVAFAGTRFAPASLAFGLLLIATSLTFVNNVFGFAAVALDKPRALIKVQVPLLVANIGAGVLVVPHFGGTGEAIVLLISEALTCGAISWQFTKAAQVRLRVFRTWRVVLAGLTMVPVSIAGSALWGTRYVYIDVAVGILLLGTVYAAAITALRGIPTELRELLWRTRRKTARVESHCEQSSQHLQ